MLRILLKRRAGHNKTPSHPATYSTGNGTEESKLKQFGRISTRKPRLPYRPPQRATLLELPQELLDQIIDAVQFKELCILRLVCSQMNDITKSCVLRSVNLTGDRIQLEAMLALAASSSSYYETVERLYLEKFQTKRSGFIKNSDFRFQSRNLCPTIKTFKSLKHVQWQIPPDLELNKSILQAIQSIASLESIQFHFPRYPYDPVASCWLYDLGSPGFSNLKSITLHAIYACCYIQAYTDYVSDTTHSLLASCPALAHLEIVSELRDTLDADLTRIVKDLPNKATFQPNLRTLRLVGMDLSPSPLSLQYLANLKSLDIANLRLADDRVWQGLASSAIHLEIIKVMQVTDLLVGYLLRYTGLREFHIAHEDGLSSYLDVPPPNNHVKERLFRSGVPHHCDTLVAFCVHAKLNRYLGPRLKAWCINAEQLSCLRGLPRLERLEGIFEYGHSGKGVIIPLQDVITGLFTLSSSLQNVRFVPVYDNPPKRQVDLESLFRHLKYLRIPGPSLNHPLLNCIFWYDRRCPVIYDRAEARYRIDTIELEEPSTLVGFRT